MTISAKFHSLLHFFPAKGLLKPLVAVTGPWNEVVLGRPTPQKTLADLAGSRHRGVTSAVCDKSSAQTFGNGRVWGTRVRWQMGSCKQRMYGACLDQFTRLIQVVHHHGFGVDTKCMIDGGQQFRGMNGVFDRGGSRFI